MQRLPIWLLVGSLLVGWLLAGCNQPAREAAGANRSSVHGPAARTPRHWAEVRGWEVIFYLEGYQAPEPPYIQVRQADGWDRSPATRVLQTDRGAEARLSFENIPGIPAEHLEYRWKLPDGRTLSGSILYKSPETDLDWTVTLTAHLAVYHVAPLFPEEAADLEAAYQRVAQWSGLTAEGGLIPIYLYPYQFGEEAWSELVASTEIGGFSSGRRVFMPTHAGWPETISVLVHELVHALGLDSGLRDWLSEGFATYVELLDRLHRSEPASAEALLQALSEPVQRLVERARQENLSFYYLKLEDDGELYPYIVGYSFVLFVQSRYGHEGVRSLMQHLGAAGVSSQSLEGFFGRPFGQIEDDWNAYLRSGQVLAGHRSLMDLAR